MAFLRPTGSPSVPDAWRETVIKVIRQRLALHEHPEAVADALEAVPRSRPFGELSELAAIVAPTAVVASADEADPEHPQARGGGLCGRDPGRAAGDRRAGTLAHRVAGEPALEGDRRHRGADHPRVSGYPTITCSTLPFAGAR